MRTKREYLQIFFLAKKLLIENRFKNLKEALMELFKDINPDDLWKYFSNKEVLIIMKHLHALWNSLAIRLFLQFWLQRQRNWADKFENSFFIRSGYWKHLRLSTYVLDSTLAILRLQVKFASQNKPRIYSNGHLESGMRHRLNFSLNVVFKF